MCFGVNAFRNPDIMTIALEYVVDESFFAPVEVACESDNSAAMFWEQIMLAYTLEHESFDEDDLSHVVQTMQECFSLEFIIKIIDNEALYIDDQLLDIIGLAHSSFLMRDMAKNSARWLFEQEMDVDTNRRFFNAFSSLPQPFNDKRFDVYPVATHTTSGGHAFPETIYGLTGGLVEHLVDGVQVLQRAESVNESFTMDALMGLIFYFKNKPSFLVSFNVDGVGDIYVKQVQCQHKDRGNFKLGKQWREKAVEYVSYVFPQSQVFLVDGAMVSERIFSGYPKGHPRKTDLAIRKRVKQVYDGMFAGTVDMMNVVMAGEHQYRQIM